MLEKVIRLRCRHDINVTKSGMILSKIVTDHSPNQTGKEKDMTSILSQNFDLKSASASEVTTVWRYRNSIIIITIIIIIKNREFYCDK